MLKYLRKLLLIAEEFIQRADMRYLLDTNIVIAYSKRERDIVDKIKSINEINISCITLGEVYLGVALSTQKEKNMNEINKFILDCFVYDIDSLTAYHYSLIKAKTRAMGKPIPDNDLWIAAVAEQHDLIIVTRDKHFLNLDFIKTEIW